MVQGGLPDLFNSANPTPRNPSAVAARVLKSAGGPVTKPLQVPNGKKLKEGRELLPSGRHYWPRTPHWKSIKSLTSKPPAHDSHLKFLTLPLHDFYPLLRTYSIFCALTDPSSSRFRTDPHSGTNNGSPYFFVGKHVRLVERILRGERIPFDKMKGAVSKEEQEVVGEDAERRYGAVKDFAVIADFCLGEGIYQDAVALGQDAREAARKWEDKMQRDIELSRKGDEEMDLEVGDYVDRDLLGRCLKLFKMNATPPGTPVLGPSDPKGPIWPPNATQLSKLSIKAALKSFFSLSPKHTPTTNSRN
ncbi:hypothetical protein MNV49_004447 [Pseudohyphozyma bogoriensis]|nr:hypothetical protein MNV49_004447 [Pseudohyphozyma bogoriensis]